jgi:hypothetical protein
VRGEDGEAADDGGDRGDQQQAEVAGKVAAVGR